MAIDVTFTSGEPAVEIEPGIRSKVIVRLEPRWLVDVWWRGLSDVGGQFVLQARGLRRDRSTVVTVRIPDEARVEVRTGEARRIAGGWSLVGPRG